MVGERVLSGNSLGLVYHLAGLLAVQGLRLSFAEEYRLSGYGGTKIPHPRRRLVGKNLPVNAVEIQVPSWAGKIL